MRPEDVLEFARKRPFEPFRITMTGGQTYDVMHPEMVIVSRSVLAVGRPRKRKPDQADVITTLALIHVVQIEPLSSPKLKSDNGHANET